VLVRATRVVVPITELDLFVAIRTGPTISTSTGVGGMPRARTRSSILARAVPVTVVHTIVAVGASPSWVATAAGVTIALGAIARSAMLTRVVVPVAVRDAIVALISTPTVVARARVAVTVAFTISIG
jgi:hypothetical protein